MQNSLSTATYGLLGHPLGHSFSKLFFTELFAEEGNGLEYENFDLPELTNSALYNMLLTAPELRGFNVTAPYKHKIMEMLDGIDSVASEVGAVNTVAVERLESGFVSKLYGFNTDVIGLRDSIMPLLENLTPDKGALVLGTGGASDAAEYVFRHLGRPVLKVSRTGHKAENIITYSDITANLLTEYPVVINCTPAGTYPNIDTCPPIPYQLLCPGNICFDMVYNPDPSLFLRKAAERGATTKSGAEMLVLQALASLRIWRSMENKTLNNK